MPTYADWMRVRDAAREELQRRGYPPMDAAISVRAKTVLEHPGWQMLLDWIATAQERGNKFREGMLLRVADGNLTAQEREWHLLDLRERKGYLQALVDVATLIPSLVQGEGQEGETRT